MYVFVILWTYYHPAWWLEGVVHAVSHIVLVKRMDAWMLNVQCGTASILQSAESEKRFIACRLTFINVAVKLIIESVKSLPSQTTPPL